MSYSRSLHIGTHLSPVGVTNGRIAPYPSLSPWERGPSNLRCGCFRRPFSHGEKDRMRGGTPVMAEPCNSRSPPQLLQQGDRAMSGNRLLSIRGVETYYGNIRALKGVDLDVHEGEIVTLIGSNGAGKSTLMMTICGDPRARAGKIRLRGADIVKLPTHEIMRLSIAQSPEGRCIFPRMTVHENLLMGAMLAPKRRGCAERRS